MLATVGANPGPTDNRQLELNSRVAVAQGELLGHKAPLSKHAHCGGQQQITKLGGHIPQGGRPGQEGSYCCKHMVHSNMPCLA